MPTESGRSVVLVGEVGCGKSALVEQLARRMVEEDVPEPCGTSASSPHLLQLTLRRRRLACARSGFGAFGSRLKPATWSWRCRASRRCRAPGCVLGPWMPRSANGKSGIRLIDVDAHAWTETPESRFGGRMLAPVRIAPMGPGTRR